MLVERLTASQSALDLQTGGGEVLAEVLAKMPRPPGLVAATESWPPNAEIARRNLSPYGASVFGVDDEDELPFPAGSFELVVSRHPTYPIWDEIARVLRPDGTYLSQQIGAGSNRELSDFPMGPQPVAQARSSQRAVAEATEAGLEVIDLRQEDLEVAFEEVGAVVHFLRKVFWTVPGFSVNAYREPLRRLHDQMQRDGPFLAHSQRFLIEARKAAR
jgi:SAM-dependent methyltransferase